jgi:dihydroorotate dehydrogenase
MYRLIRPLLFRLDAEEAHRLTIGSLRLAGAVPLAPTLLRALFAGPDDDRLAVTVCGIRFRNPVGLAAGYDKAGGAVRGLGALGFGHVEVGSLTPSPQAGNARPRVHRLEEVEAIVNHMGFPNPGIGALRLPRAGLGDVRVGVSLGKGNDTPLERAADDYCALLRQAQPVADYAAINVSCPNVGDLRGLHRRGPLAALLGAIVAVRNGLTPRIPLFLKLAPDLGEAELDDALQAVADSGIDGVIATNTTTGRAGAPARAAALEGGLSGRPLRARATEVVRAIARRTAGRLPIIGVGGVMSPGDALEKLEAGAALVQVYTGMVYRGPSLPREINRRLLAECERRRLTSIAQLHESQAVSENPEPAKRVCDERGLSRAAPQRETTKPTRPSGFRTPPS